ncbi:hypothetical protein SAMN02744037_02132 [Tepidibacter formicigenes DSM 15518]|uniref:Uncharacterized protein n=2 Tax=Tepidibacter TaxID=214904 RepID=A0A1M6RK71_9FIRM|nr:hypothetical protein SAMN02744037_02132 [Tepidibacter formicigenes DSM 15518]
MYINKKGMVKVIANKVILQSLYKDIILEFSRLTGKTVEESMEYFYQSVTYELISEGIGDMHCKGVKYLTQELMLEYGFMKHKSFSKDFVYDLNKDKKLKG